MKVLVAAIVSVLVAGAAVRATGEVVNVGAPVGVFWVANAIGWVQCNGGPTGYHEVATNYRNTGDVSGRPHGVVWIRDLRAGDTVEISLWAGCQRCVGGFPKGCGCASASVHWIDSDTDPTVLVGAAVSSLPATSNNGGCILGPVVIQSSGEHSGLMLVFSGSGSSSVYNAYSAQFTGVTVTMPDHATLVTPDGAVSDVESSWGALKSRYR